MLLKKTRPYRQKIGILKDENLLSLRISRRSYFSKLHTRSGISIFDRHKSYGKGSKFSGWSPLRFWQDVLCIQFRLLGDYAHLAWPKRENGSGANSSRVNHHNTCKTVYNRKVFRCWCKQQTDCSRPLSIWQYCPLYQRHSCWRHRNIKKRRRGSQKLHRKPWTG